MLTPDHVLEEIKRRSADLGDPIRFYWVVISAEDDGGDRDRFARSLSQQAFTHPLVPVVLRTPGFMDPNSVMNDLAAVLEDSKTDILDGGMRRRISQEGYVDVVLVSRKELALAVTSHPCSSPAGFPCSRNEKWAARIFDLTWTASVPLSATEVHTEDVRRLLYDLDCALVKRLRVVGESDRRLESIFAVLHRPTTPIGDPAVRWALDVIVTVLAACQLTTAAAHADEYSRYPVRLVGSLSRDLRRALDGFIKVLEL